MPAAIPALRRGVTNYVPNVRATKSAYFYRKTHPLSDAAVRRAFDSAMEAASGNALQRIVAQPIDVKGRGARYSFLLFKEESQPSFLEGTTIRDLSHCFLLICELPTMVAVFKAGAPFDDAAFGDSIAAVDHDTLRRLFRSGNTAYLKLRLRMMGIARAGIRARSAEADDLQVSMSTVGANRSIPTGFQVRDGEGIYTVTPSTGRIGERDVRVAHADLLAWSAKVEDAINNPAADGGFMEYFAKPCDLAVLPAAVVPTGILFHLDRLEEAIADGTVLRLLQKRAAGQKTTVMNAAAVQKLFDEGRREYDVREVSREIVTTGLNNRKRGSLKINKNAITVASSSTDRVVLEYSDGREKTLTRFLNDGQDFIVCFSDPCYAYTSRQLFRDHNLLTALDGLLSIFVPIPGLANVVSEKGQVTAASTRFGSTSIFGVIQDAIAVADDVLVCDDLGDEWADFLGVQSDVANPALSFYVAKDGEVAVSLRNDPRLCHRVDE